MKTILTIPKNSNDCGGIYKITQKGDIIEMCFWEHDSSWMNPGKRIMEFDKGNLSVVYKGDDFTVFEWAILCDYLRQSDSTWFNDYELVEIKGAK